MDINFEKISFISFCVIVSYKIFIKLGSIFYPRKIIYWKSLRYYPTISIIYIPILNIRRFFPFIVILQLFVISFCISINRRTYSSYNTFFYHKNMSISTERYNFTFVIFRAACLTYPGIEKHFAGSSLYTSRNIFLKFRNKSANNNVSLSSYKSLCSPIFFISKSLQNLFACASVISYISK